MPNLTVSHFYYPDFKDGKPLVAFRIVFPDEDRPAVIPSVIDGQPEKTPDGKPAMTADLREIKITYRQLRPRPTAEPDPEQRDNIIWGFYRDEPYMKVLAIGAVQQYMKGKLALYLKWGDKEGKEKEWEGEFTSGNELNVDKSLKLPSTRHRISTLLAGPEIPLEGWGPRATELEPTNDLPEMVAQVLKHVHDGLLRGLENFWQFYGADACKEHHVLRSIADSELEGLTAEQVEECWAQHVTEMLVGACYGGPGPIMSAPGGTSTNEQDAWVLKNFTRSSDPVCSLVFACQQLNSMLLMARGHDSLADSPLDANTPDAGSLPGSTLLDNDKHDSDLFGQIVADKKATVSMKTAGKVWLKGETAESNPPVLRPGTSFWVNKTRPAAVHCAGALRVWRAGFAQLMDTGTWIWDDPLGAGQGYMRDTEAVSSLASGNEGCKAILVPPELTVAQLIEAIRHIRQTRPLGVMRLIISRKPAYSGAPMEKEDVYWVSRLLPMHEDPTDGRQSYSIARLFVAMRGFPHRQHFNLTLHVFVPKGRESCEEAAKEGAGSNRWWWDAETSKRRKLYALARVQVGDDGIPRLLEHVGMESFPKNGLPWQDRLLSFDNEPFGSYDSLRGDYPNLADMTQAQTDVAAYFKGTSISS